MWEYFDSQHLPSIYYWQHQIACTASKGYEVFSDVTGGRPPSFSRLISGGSRSPRLVGGMRSPASGTQISRRKGQAGSRGTEEKTS
jgi:hypothetical protein